jgi:hypothetical protein
MEMAAPANGWQKVFARSGLGKPKTINFAVNDLVRECRAIVAR